MQITVVSKFVQTAATCELSSAPVSTPASCLRLFAAVQVGCAAEFPGAKCH